MAEMKDEEACSICLGELKNPKIINCFHCFCSHCLEDFIQKTSIEGHFQCPLCRHDIRTPEGGVNNFPTKWKKSETFRLKSVPKCSRCEINSSEYDCRQCKLYLCETCKNNHEAVDKCDFCVTLSVTADLGGDNSVDIDGSSANTGPTEFCPNHDSRRVDIYCEQCLIAVCWKCFVSQHNGHKMFDLHDEDVKELIKGELVSLNDDIKVHVRKLEEFYERLEEKLDEMSNPVQAACDLVDEQVAKVIAEVTKIGESMKENIKQLQEQEQRGSPDSDKESSITETMKDIQILTEELKASLKYSSNILADDSIIQMIDRLPRVRQLEEECSSKKLEVPFVSLVKFQRGLIDSAVLAKQVGRIVKEGKRIFEHDFQWRGMSTNSPVYSPRFVHQGRQWRVGILCRSGLGILDVFLHGGTHEHSFTIKLVNYSDDGMSVVKQGRCDYEVGLVRWSVLSDPGQGFMSGNEFTIQVLDIRKG